MTLWLLDCSMMHPNMAQNRKHRCCHSPQVVLYFAAIVCILTLFGVMTAPDIIREGSDFVTRLKSDNVWVVVLEKMRHGLG